MTGRSCTTAGAYFELRKKFQRIRTGRGLLTSYLHELVANKELNYEISPSVESDVSP